MQSGARDTLRSIVSDLRASVRDLPVFARWCAYFYLAHILAQGKIALSEIALSLTLLFFVIAFARREIRRSFHIIYYPLALYGLVSTVSGLVNHSTTHAFGEAALWMKMLVFPAALMLFRSFPAVRIGALASQALFAAAIAAYGIFQYFTTAQRDLEHRITGPSTHVMTYSGLLLPVSLLMVVLAAHRRRPWMIAAAVLPTFALLLTFTRSVWLGWLVAIFAVLALKRSRWMMYAVPLLLIFVSFMPEAMFGRLLSSFDVKQSSNLDRIRMAQAGVEIIKDHPVFGVGPAQVKEVYPLYRAEDAPRFRPPHLHNNLIQLWAERGVLAVAAYLLLLGLFLRECWRGWGGPGAMFAEAGVAIAVGLAYAGLFEFNFGDTEVFLVMLELYALVIASLEAAAAGAEALPNEPSPATVPPIPALVQPGA